MMPSKKSFSSSLPLADLPGSVITTALSSVKAENGGKVAFIEGFVQEFNDMFRICGEHSRHSPVSIALCRINYRKRARSIASAIA